MRRRCILGGWRQGDGGVLIEGAYCLAGSGLRIVESH